MGKKMRAKGFSNDCQQHEYKKMKRTQAVLPPSQLWIASIYPSGFFFFSSWKGWSIRTRASSVDGARVDDDDVQINK